MRCRQATKGTYSINTTGGIQIGSPQEPTNRRIENLQS